MSRDARSGLVSLVGAGPGDPGLITVAGLERLKRADVVIYDRLVSPSLLQQARPGAERIDVGKRAAGPSTAQEQIDDLLLEHARRGEAVVRLKGGDPFVFGRGAEEAQRLLREGIAVEIIPGVTSATAVPAYAGIPVTHRDYASSFAVISGQESVTKPDSAIEWAGGGRGGRGADTLVFLMAREPLPEIAARLIGRGHSPQTPAAVVQWGTTARQRVVEGTLETIAAAADKAGLQPPVVTVVGNVVRLRRELQWFERRPLFGKRVLVTRARHQAAAMIEQLEREGAEPLAFPTIEIAPVDPAPARDAVRRLGQNSYDWAILTSANGVRALFDHLDAEGLDARAFAGVRIAAIGAETARALRERGLNADVLPDEFVAESLLDALPAAGMAGARVLLARAQDSRALLPEGLRSRGAVVDDVPLYVARPPERADPDVLRRIEAGEIDVATFSASSTVRGCLELLDGRTELLAGALIACIGPVTAATAEAAGLRVDLVSEEHTIPGLIDALRRRFGQERAVTHA